MNIPRRVPQPASQVVIHLELVREKASPSLWWQLYVGIPGHGAPLSKIWTCDDGLLTEGQMRDMITRVSKYVLDGILASGGTTAADWAQWRLRRAEEGEDTA